MTGGYRGTSQNPPTQATIGHAGSWQQSAVSAQAVPSAMHAPSSDSGTTGAHAGSIGAAVEGAVVSSLGAGITAGSPTTASRSASGPGNGLAAHPTSKNNPNIVNRMGGSMPHPARPRQMPVGERP